MAAADTSARALLRAPVAPVEARATPERDALIRVAAAAAAATGLEDVVGLAADAACEALQAGSLSISRWERSEDAMRVLINSGSLAAWEERYPADEVYPLAEHPAVGRLLRSGQPYFNAIDDPDADPESVELLRSLGKESDIGVPIVVDGEVWGEVWASTSPGAPRFHARDVRFLEAVAAQLAGVIARAELFSNVSRLAYEDPLTGLANRRAFEERLALAVAQCAEAGIALTLLVCDLDGLKQINDERGHPTGDRALRRVADALRAAASPFPSAFVTRISGDEFAVLLEGLDLDSARDVAATALRLLGEDRDLPATISCGAAGAREGTGDPAPLLAAADAALYAAKRRGGAQLCTADAAARPAEEETGRPERAATIVETTERVLARLDGELAGGRALDRLEAVAEAFADRLRAAGWTISFSAHGSADIRSLVTAERRDGRLRGVPVGLEDDVYALDDYPATAGLVAAQAGSFHVSAADPGSDDAERRLLGELGYDAVLAAAVPDLEGVYLLELFGDEGSADLGGAGLALQLIMRAAAGRSANEQEHAERLRKRTLQLGLTSALGRRLSGALGTRGIADAVVDELHRTFGHPVCSVVQLRDGVLDIAAARGEAAEALHEAGWTSPAGLGLIGRALRENEVVTVGDVRAEPDYRVTATTPDSRSELCAPLWAGDRLWGAIDLQSPEAGAFDEDDAEFLAAIAEQVGAALRTAGLYAQLEKAYIGTAEALAAALEAKDSYTAEHSTSITENALAVGLRLGMGEAELRTLRFGAAFHDIGKLAIPERILNKRGPLTPEERREIERHTIIGEQILAPIEFLADVRPIVRHGHERFDGAGYPDGLSGASIPLGARIVFACDAYDAMTTDRPYRAALSDGEARSELAANAGTQFDPEVVAALLAVLDEAPAAASPDGEPLSLD